MRAKTLFFAAALAFIAFCASASTPRITFERTIAPLHDLGAQDVAVVYAIGDHAAISEFVQELVDHANRPGTLRVENAVDGNRYLSDLPSFRKRHHADVYLGVKAFSCEGKERQAEGTEHDVDGGRVKRTYQWLDAICTARVDVLHAADGSKLLSFTVKGEGTSPRSASLTDDEREIAFTQAAHYAGRTAAEAVTPRAVRETIELDSAAPAFDEGYAMITSDRLADARAIWEATLRQHRNSAALIFNLAALSEAMGDVAAAARYFELAPQLQPKEQRYRSELSLFHKRRGPRRP
jgi:hypothetical protein